jgi:O-antigen ligase
MWNLLPADKQSYATSFDSGRENIMLRYRSATYAMDLFKQDPILGMGVGLRKQYDATNLVLLTMAETGLLGLAAFALWHAVFFASIWRARRAVPTDDPRYSFLVLGAALVLGKLIHGLVDHYWGRGSLGIAWSAAGMAWGVTMAARATRPGGYPVVLPVAKPAPSGPVGATAMALAR